MKNIKQRSPAQITGDKAVHIIHSLLSEEWVMRELQPDYGLDLLIEFFETDTECECCLATGEFIFAQVKGRKTLSLDRLKKNILFRIDTALLTAVDLMPKGVPVILLIVNISTNDVYFLCLNDYLDKHLKLLHPDFAEQKTITLTIPANNRLNELDTVSILQWFGKRRIIPEVLSSLMICKSWEEMLPKLDWLLDGWKSIDMIFNQAKLFSDLTVSLETLRNQIIYLHSFVQDEVVWEENSQILFDNIRECLLFYEENCRTLFI